MKNKNGKTKGLFIAIAILAILVFAGSWLYLNSQQSTIKVVSDKTAYFGTDNPQVEIILLNAKKADSGTIRVRYDNSILNLAENELSEGVSMEELQNNLIFNLSEDYFNNKSNSVAKLTFSYAGNAGTAEIKVDENESFLNIKGEEMPIAKAENASFEIGQAPARH
jgi:hypothetical protein